MLSDTSPEAEKVQIELIRRCSVAERIARMRSLTAIGTRMSRQAIAEANPKLDAREVDLRWMELHYGRELADEYRAFLQERALLQERRACSPRT